VLRNIIVIDEEKCDGCGQCVTACAEGAIRIVDGKAKLISESYCDGLGACLGHCPRQAITVEQRDVPAFDEQAVQGHLAAQSAEESVAPPTPPLGFVCPGMAVRRLTPSQAPPADGNGPAVPSALRQWPVQLSLLSPTAEFLKGAELLLVADCVPLAVGDFHSRWLAGKAVAIACPKLDDREAHAKKLAAILKTARPACLTVLHMEVPCCSGLTRLAERALAAAGVDVPVEDITIALDGRVVAPSPKAASASLG